MEFQVGETKELNVTLTSITPPVPSIAIEQFFIGTSKLDWETGADLGIYIQIKNTGDTQVSGTVYTYDWQEWWNDPPGDDRRWTTANFTLAPGGVLRCQDKIHDLAFDKTYIRVEVVVNDVVVAETPRVYIIPGKKYTGTERIAVGECTYVAAGLAVLWYSQYSECKVWQGSYSTPPGHWGSFEYRTTQYDNKWWPAVFCVIFDPGFISGAEYECRILGGAAGAAWRSARFNFTAA